MNFMRKMTDLAKPMDREQAPIYWKWATFQRLDKTSCYRILSLRAQVFVEEQNYAYNDLDGRDQNALHLMGYDCKKSSIPQLVAYARIILPGKKEQPLELSRVVVHPDYRKLGVGKQLLREVSKKMDTSYAFQAASVTFAAKDQHLEKFYGAIGFIKQPGFSTNPQYQYKNFQFEAYEMRRPPALSAEQERHSFSAWFKQAKGYSKQLFFQQKRKKAEEKVQVVLRPRGG